MIRVLIAEDQEIVRRGLKLLLGTQPDIEVVGEAENGQQAIELMASLAEKSKAPHVVLMDIKMPVLNGVEATKVMSARFPEAKIVVLTTFADNEFVSEALSYGAKGYLLKDTPLEELADVIRSIDKGYTQFGPGILEKVVADKPVTGQSISDESEVDKAAVAQATTGIEQTIVAEEPPPSLQALSAKEKEVLALIVQGASNKEIAAALFISEGTVRNHVTHILGRLNVRDRTQAAIMSHAFLPYLQSKNA